ncbi:MAG TPA: NAD(P)-dependent alcohol dehydrogenase, partial [Chitinophagaceae bacterium]|nr:NAD(P)-dependent alcohol dehydrogenase [Chitinophagaceae bacterium]
EVPVKQHTTGTHSTKSYAAMDVAQPLQPFDIERRNTGPHDVMAEIMYCGVCHSDLHFVRNDWGMSIYPLVPGHEIVGRVMKVGSHVTKYKVGDLVGIGCLVNSCRTCDNCKEGEEQYCTNGWISTYSGMDKDGSITYGGYSKQIVCDENYVLRINDTMPLERVAPLLCAGITTYSPMRHWNVKAGQRVGVVGLGGLGHMAVKFGVSFGTEVTVFSTSEHKQADATALGAHRFVASTNEEQLKANAGYFDFIIDTVSASHDYNAYLPLLRTSGVMVCVGIPPEPAHIPAFNLVFQRRSLAGSLIGGIAQTQEMLDYCAINNIAADVEVISMKDINEAYERMERSDVKYRFVIDMATL